MQSDPEIPAACWIAPEIPQAMYSLGPTVLPVWPTWCARGIQPSSTAAREAPTVAPSTSANSRITLKPSSEPTPRPPDTMISASSRLTAAATSSILSISFVLIWSAATWMSSRVIVPSLPSTSSGFLNTPGRTVPSCGLLSGQRIIAIRLPPNAGRVQTMLPASTS